VLTATAVLIALPGLRIGSILAVGFIYSLLPLTASELHAIDVAETFVKRNGYTSAGHPTDLPVLPTDIMDALAGLEEHLLEMRKGTLEARAFGIRSVDSGFLVFFESIPPRTNGPYRTLAVDEDGHARMLHQDTFAWWPKKAER
jgi:hypothetical protein